MSFRSFAGHRIARLAGVVCGIAALAGGWSPSARAQFGGGFGRFSAVGGIAIDADGVVRNQTTDELGELRQERLDALRAVSGDLKQSSELRMVSLRRLDELLASQQGMVEERTDDVRFLAGLQRVKYVFVFPERNDIVLAGPAEGWKIDRRGHVVGNTTGRPVLMLDDLLVALRTADAAAQGGLTCSIDPTTAGIDSLQSFVRTQSTFGPDTVAGMEKSLGLQTVTIAGVPADSHFARVMFAADYRMKRLAMAFDPSPVPGLSSFIQTVAAGGKGIQDVQQRWWLATNYESLLRSPDGLAWEVRGPGVKCMTEDEILVAGGVRQRAGKSNPLAQQWAEKMTEKYDELAAKDPIFGDLRNCMDLAVVAALIAKENLAARASANLPQLLGSQAVGLTESLDAPRQVPTLVKAIKKGRNWIISASGGVEIASWQVADNVQESAALADTMARGRPDQTQQRWWWDAANAAAN
jgi:hypothetical protein